MHARSCPISLGRAFLVHRYSRGEHSPNILLGTAYSAYLLAFLEHKRLQALETNWPFSSSITSKVRCQNVSLITKDGKPVSCFKAITRSSIFLSLSGFSAVEALQHILEDETISLLAKPKAFTMLRDTWILHASVYFSTQIWSAILSTTNHTINGTQNTMTRSNSTDFLSTGCLILDI